MKFNVDIGCNYTVVYASITVAIPQLSFEVTNDDRKYWINMRTRHNDYVG